MVQIETFIPLFIAFGLGIASGFFVKYFQDRYLRPVIKIQDDVFTAMISLKKYSLLPGDYDTYYANRIRVRNTGRSAAKDCKVYVEYHKTILNRSGWMLPDRNSGYTVTLNVQDSEFVDLCAIREDGKQRILPLERGYTEGAVDLCTTLPNDINELAVRVTSSNAEPTERKVRLYNVINHFPGYYGRIVEFIECRSPPQKPGPEKSQGIENQDGSDKRKGKG